MLYPVMCFLKLLIKKNVGGVWRIAHQIQMRKVSRLDVIAELSLHLALANGLGIFIIKKLVLSYFFLSLSSFQQRQ